jgi:hypothetical protein
MRMRKFLVAIGVCSVMLSCNTVRNTQSTDDVYVNPAEERRKAQQLAEEKARLAAAQKEREEAEKKAAETKPEYEDRGFKSGEYYDYAYAARINRFHRPLYGAGYYDPYYTNHYTYNPDPFLYGTSIYTGYSNYGMPSSMFNGYSFGISTSWGYPYGAAWPYGYRPYGAFGYYDPWYDPAAYYSPFYNPYYGYAPYGPWGYYNSLDANSYRAPVSTGPRESSGSNTGGGRSTEHARYLEEAGSRQLSRPRFDPQDSRQNRQDVPNNPAGRSNPTIDNPPPPANTRRPAERGTRMEQSPRQGRQSAPAPTPAPAPSGGSTPRGNSGSNSHRPR